MTLDHHDEATAHAMRVVARHVLHRAVHAYLDDDTWECYPDLGQFDWEDVGRVASQLAPTPDVQEFDAAYALLAARAEGQEA